MNTTGPTVAELLEHFRPYAEQTARRYGRRYPWMFDDFVSEALYRLLRAVAAGRVTADTPPPFVRRIARLACLDRFKKEVVCNPVGFRVQADPTAGDPLALLPDRGREAPEVDDAEYVGKLLARLTPANRALLVRHVVGGELLTDIGAETGSTRAAVSERLGRALRKLRKVAAG